jgi:hypothetical protein
MSAQNIIIWLDAKNGQVNTPAEIAQLKSDLRVQLATLSVEVANQKANAVTLLYRGEMGKNGVKVWQVAEDISKRSDGAGRTMGQSDSSKFLSSDEFDRAFKGAINDSKDVSSEILDGKIQNSVRAEVGIWDWSSEHLVNAALGETRFMGSFATNAAVFTQTELKAFLHGGSSKPRVVGSIPASRTTAPQPG